MKKAESYGSYLKIPELLSLQRPLSEPAEHDELLFIIIHQVYELWFKLMIHEVTAVREASRKGQIRRSARAYRRLIEIQRVLLQQISILETMTPADFLRFRDHLNPASGFQSHQFRELEFLSGMKDASTFPYLKLTDEDRKRLELRLVEPDLRDAFDQTLRFSGFEIPAEGVPGPVSGPRPAPAPGGGPPPPGDDPRRAARVEALKKIYSRPEDYYDLYNLCESMIEYDENFQLWRYHHVLMVERMIGHKMGTGGSEGVGYLSTTLKKRCFPELWEARTHLGGGGGYGA